MKKRISPVNIIVFLVFCVSISSFGQVIQLGDMDLKTIDQIHYSPKADSTVHGKPIIIDCVKYDNGLGLHAHSASYIKLHKDAKIFKGVFGYDQTQNYHPAANKVILTIIGDDRIIFKSEPLGFWDKGIHINIDLKGIDVLQIWILGDKGSFTTACNFGDAVIEYENTAPKMFSPKFQESYILTPKVKPSPRFNGSKIYGARPGNPIRYQLAVSGTSPFTFHSDNLPSGLSLNTSTGLLTGQLNEKGEYSFTVHAKNKHGKATENYTIKVGDKICLTPPMGWSSWNVWTADIDQEKVFETLQAYQKYNLQQYGWTYINIDDGWQGKRGGNFNAIMPNKKFPDMKLMIDSIHRSGYKFGIYSSPWKTTYAGYIGSSADFINGHTEIEEWSYGVYPFHNEDVKQWVDWGVDYLKYDWWPNDVSHTRAMSEALKSSGRDIVFSISNAADYDKAVQWQKHANLWRTTGDIMDSWPSVMALGFSQERWAEYAGPGHWNDPDMMVVGWNGIHEELHKTRLSADEQYTHVSMWAMLSAPLILGCDLSKMDEFTLGLITNPEVIDINQDELGHQAIRIAKDDLKEVWLKKLSDGSIAVGLFNRGLNEADIKLDWISANLTGNKIVRDVWRQTDLGKYKESFTATVPGHGVLLLHVY